MYAADPGKGWMFGTSALRDDRNHALHALVLVVWLLLALDGCTTLRDGRNWGQDATFAPGWQHVREAAADAAKSPRVWLPLAGAALFQIDDWDRQTSDWARENTPIFGSQRNAEDFSDKLNMASDLAYLATVVATSSGD